jgi:hypothetical protein
MTNPAFNPSYSSALPLITAIEQFDGACDTDFDTALDELERQFAEYRLTLANQ